MIENHFFRPPIMGRFTDKIRRVLALGVGFGGMTATPLLAITAAWQTAPASGDWNTAANWSGAVVPNGDGDIASFGPSSSITAVSLSASTALDSLKFESANTAFSIKVSPRITLTFSGAGVVNPSAGGQQLVLLADGYNAVGQVTFGGSATAGNINYLTFGGTEGGAGGGQVLFLDSATAGSGRFTNSGGAGSNAFGGSVVFRNTSTAGSAQITNGGGYGYLSQGGKVYFQGSASAAGSTIINEAHQGYLANGANTMFIDEATAASSTLIANGSSDGRGGGWIMFHNNSTGGQATVKVYGDGILSISAHNAPGVTIGSIEGTGGVLMGSNTLTVGSNDLSTSFAGSIINGGALAKIGRGTLTLSGQSSYPGGTTIGAGALVVTNTSGSALGTGPVTVADGATLGGSGFIGGATTVASGAHLAPGNRTGTLTLTNGLSLERGAILDIELGSTSDRIDVTGGTLSGTAGVGGITLNLSNAGGFAEGVAYPLIKFAGAQASELEATDFSIGTPISMTSAAGYALAIVDNALVLTYTAPPASRLVNISTRAYCATGDNVTIGGFVIAGSATKRVLIRAVGPSLTSSGLAAGELLADPTIEVHNAATGAVVATNDNWTANPNAAEITSTAATIGASALLASDTTSSALLTDLSAGVYSFVVKGKNDTAGIVLLEVYAADTSTAAAFTNISSRAYAVTGNGVAIGGFVLTGNAPKRVLLRALGPTLTSQHLTTGQILQNPIIELHHGSDPVITNDNWGANDNAAEIRTVGARLGASPIDAADINSSALLLTLNPGAYSFLAQGQGGGKGIVLVEIYDAD